MTSGTTDWDAATYHRLAAPQEEWAREVLARLPLRGDETVLDAGCGSGRTTVLLLERLPRGRVVAVDGSESMVAAARKTLAPFADRVEVMHADLLDLELAEPVDLVFSNAVFHWIDDHDRLFQRLRATLRPAGALLAQCGGEGNVAEWQRAVGVAMELPEFSAFFEGWRGPWNFAGAEETEARLRSAGFTEVRCWLENRAVEPDDPRQFVTVAGLAAHHERLPEDLREPFTDAVLDHLRGPLVLRYVRLNIEARVPPS
ncbi:MAG TPA: methyltransferase domain-containing protein [Solirubrobacterales bacterium]|nr:methyltransferase domain-containing protein [Solirubrobacterales bacterium]